MVLDRRRFVSDDVVVKKRNLFLAVRIRANRMLNPESINHIRFNSGFHFGLVQTQKSISEGFSSIPIYRALGQPLECFLKLLQVNRFYLGLDDKPGYRIEIDADNITSQPEGLDDCGTSSHKGIKNCFPLGIWVMGVVLIKFLHEVR